MTTKFLNQLLERLELLSNKAVFFSNEKGRSVPEFASEIQSKLVLMKPDAYYSFNNQPYILFFDLSNEINVEREDEIHKQAWSFDSTPVIFIIKKSDIEVFNAFYYQKESNRLEKLSNDKQEIIERFSFWNIQSGETWKWLQATKYKDTINKKRVNQRLFDNIKEARLKLEENGLTASDANTTILRLIFIRYLIDRGVGIKKEFISGDTIFEKRKQLSELIQNTTKLSEFFEYLNERFNGTLFKQKSSFRLKKEQALFLSEIFDSRKDKVTTTLFDNFYFDVFDFSIIPVEVISGIYESVIDDEIKDNDSAVYTPPFLVEYILSETVDKYLKKHKTSECKIFDPACGSGIFLVQSYRRMVDEELRKNRYIRIESTRLREIAENNLFGIDLNEQALLVASFSIYIAILDYKEPKEINRFQFPNLIGKNLFKANFFDTNHEFNTIFQDIEFDFILGNPPWKNKKDDKVHRKYIMEKNITVGRYEVAQTFLLRSESFMSINTRSALIVTSSIFYNISSTTKSFKNNFLNKFYLDIFFDLSAVRRMVFESAISPASIVFYRKITSKEAIKNVVSHYSIKSNIFLKYFKTLVIEKFDRKEILQKYFIEYDWMFKVALYGNTLDFHFLNKLISNRKIIEKFTDEKNIYVGDGISKGTPIKYFSFLESLPIIEANEVSEYYTTVDEHSKTLKKADTFLERGRIKELFIGHHIFLKARAKNESNIVISYSDKSCAFRTRVYGMTTSKNIDDLKVLYNFLISPLYKYFMYLTSSYWGIGTRPELRIEEYLSFPLPTINQNLYNQLLELFERFIHPIREHSSKEIKSENLPVKKQILEKIEASVNLSYNVTEVEKDLIDYVVNISVFQFQESKQDLFLKKIHNDKPFLKNYVDVFFSELDGIYEEEYLQAEIYPLNYFIAINFKMLKRKPTEPEKIKIVYDVTDESKVLSIISTSLSIWSLTDSRNKENNIFIQKDIKGFEKDSFYIIKPNEYKCWHRAMAWYDVAEVKSVIENAEVEMLNEKE